MLYKMIYFSSNKSAFSNLRFSPFYERIRQLREKYAFKLKTKCIMLISSLSPDLMMYIHMNFSKKPLHSTYLFKIFFSLLTLSTAFLQKASGPGKNKLKFYISTSIYATFHAEMYFVFPCGNWMRISSTVNGEYF